MAKCKDRVKKFGRRAATILGPIIGPLIPQLVMAAEGAGAVLASQVPGLLWGGHQKREYVISQALKTAKEIAHPAFDAAKAMTVGQLEGAIRAAIEVSVDRLRAKADDGLAQLADWSDHAADTADPDGEDADLHAHA